MNNKVGLQKYQFYKKQYLIWIIFSSILMLLTISTIIILQLKQWKELSSLKTLKEIRQKKVNNLLIKLEKQKKLSDEKKNLQKFLTKIQKYQNVDNNLFSLFSKVTNINSKKSVIENIEVNKNKINITIICSTPEKGERKLQYLSNLPEIKNIQISAINKKENGLQFIMNGTLNI